MRHTLPKFIPYDAPVLLESAPETPPSRWERLWGRVRNEALAWKRELLDWDRERAWLSEFWENRQREWDWLARGTNLAWGFVAVALWERISRADLEELKRETNLAGKTPPNTFALIAGAGVTVWVAIHIGSWRWPMDLLGVSFVVLQAARGLMYLGSPTQEIPEARPRAQPTRRHQGSGGEDDEAFDRGWGRDEPR